MSDRSLENLMRQADHATPPPAPLPADLAGRVIRQARRRRAAKLGGALALALATAAGAVALRQAPTPPARIVDTRWAAPAIDDVDHTEARIETHLVVVEHLLAREQQRRRLALAKAIIARPDPLARLDRQVEETALIIVTRADRKLRQGDLKDSAARDYRRVIELFPRTRWATVARERLAAIEG